MSIVFTMMLFILNLDINNFAEARARYSGRSYSYTRYSYYYGGGSTVIIGGPYGSII